MSRSRALLRVVPSWGKHPSIGDILSSPGQGASGGDLGGAASGTGTADPYYYDPTYDPTGVGTGGATSNQLNPDPGTSTLDPTGTSTGDGSGGGGGGVLAPTSDGTAPSASLATSGGIPWWVYAIGGVGVVAGVAILAKRRKGGVRRKRNPSRRRRARR